MLSRLFELEEVHVFNFETTEFESEEYFKRLQPLA